MNTFRIFAALAIASCCANRASPLRSLLLSEIRSVHNHAEWFFPVNASLGGLTPQQAAWVPVNSDGKTNPNANHSVGSITSHILFWDRNALTKLRGERPKGPDTNDDTLNSFDPANWNSIVRDLDRVLTGLEQLGEHADDSQVERMAPTIEHICTHTAYHTGQIFYVRKLQGT